MNLEQVKAIAQKDEFKNVIQSNDIDYVALFGSTVKGNMHKKSDIDLLVHYTTDRKRSLFGMVELKETLEQLFEKEVDIIDKEFIYEKLQNEILQTAVPIYG